MFTAFITHPECAEHDMGEIHPECPERLGAVHDQLLASGVLGLLKHYDAPEVTREQLLRVHTPGYLAMLDAQSPRKSVVQIDRDTMLTPFTLQAARRAAGAAVLATDLVCGRQAQNAFCCVRPPGHHAERAKAMGFCFYNNVAVGAAHAIAAYGLERVAIVDFDVHHGNGTEDIFQDDPRVMLCSTFQHPLFPYTGEAPHGKHIINCPLPAGASGAVFREAVMDVWLPSLEMFRPEMVFISAGFDAHRDDDMSDLRLSEPDYSWVTRKIVDLADAHAGGRVVSTLEGGYELHSLGRSVAAHLKVLAGLY